MDLTRKQIVTSAKGYIGVKYVRHGRSPIFGLDCWGFFLRVSHDVGINVANIHNYDRVLAPVVVSLRSSSFVEVENLQIGTALVQVRKKELAGHTGIRTENGYIHATHEGVQETEIEGNFLYFDFPGVI